MSREDLFEIMHNMVEQCGWSVIMDEVLTSMSTDELKETVEHLDQHLFANHYMSEDDLSTLES